MPGTSTVPASDVRSFKVGNKEFIVGGEVTFKKERIIKVPIEDVQSLKRKYAAKLLQGMLTVAAFVTDREMSPLNADNAIIRVEYVSGRVVTVDGATLMGEDGIDENATTGQTNELVFGFDSSLDTNK